jgi:predicted acylesterase/phospholipase RssA
MGSAEHTDRTEESEMRTVIPRCLALALAGGAARGLAHIGALEVFEREGIPIHAIAGASMKGSIGALSASGLRAAQLARVARGFRFPQMVPFRRVEAPLAFTPARSSFGGGDSR